MLQSISWSDYFSTLAFLLIAYYLFVFYTYFKWDILKRIGITKAEKENIITVPSTTSGNNNDKSSVGTYAAPNDQTDLSLIIESYADEVKAFLEEAAENHIVKEEILFALKQISAKYQIVYKADTRNGVIQEIYRLIVRQFPNLVTIEELRPYLPS